MDTHRIHYFLGANTPGGFYSIYEELTDIEAMDNLYIIKDGFGSANQIFLKKVIDKLIEIDLEAELIHSASDPECLDAVNIPSLGIAYAGGASAQTMEARYPVAVEQYIDLCKYYDSGIIKSQKSAIVEINKTCRRLYARACACISAAWGVMREHVGHAIDDSVYKAIHKRGKGIVLREIPKGGKEQGKTLKRFLSAVTHNGVVSMFNTVESLAERIYVLDNNLGLAHCLLADLSEAAVQAGHDIIACPSILEPDRLEHIIIPSLSLAFVSTCGYAEYEGEYYRHIRLDAMAEGEKLKRSKARIRFSRRIFNMLMQEAVATLSDMRKQEAELAGIYDAALDTAGVAALADEHVDMLLDKKRRSEYTD